MLCSTVPAILYIDRLGRKPVLALGALSMGACHFVIAAIFAKNEHQWPTHKAAGWAAISMVWLFVIHFGWSWGPCAWILVAEVWPLSARPYGIALGASSNWMNNFIVGQVTPDMITHLRYGTFILFGVLITLGAAFVWFYGRPLSSPFPRNTPLFYFLPHNSITLNLPTTVLPPTDSLSLVPETKRLTLEEMDIVFGSSGVAAADQERMRQINAEIGLERRLSTYGTGAGGAGPDAAARGSRDSEVTADADGSGAFERAEEKEAAPYGGDHDGSSEEKIEQQQQPQQQGV